MAHILIAGLGDLGQSLAQRWLEGEHTVSAIRRSNQAPAGVDLYSQDLTDGAVLLPPDQVDLLYIILTPSDRSVEGYQRAFLHAPKRLLDALAAQQPLPPIVFVSSTAVYGEHSGEVDEKTPPKPNKFNGRILLAAEEEISTRSLTTVVRFSGIYGAGRKRLLQQVSDIESGGAGPDPTWTNRIHREDCVALLHLLGQRWIDQEMVPPVVIGTDTAPSVNTAVLNWLAAQQGISLNLSVPDIVPGKRIRSLFLAEQKIALRHPDFKSGYTEMLAVEGSGEKI